MHYSLLYSFNSLSLESGNRKSPSLSIMKKRGVLSYAGCIFYLYLLPYSGSFRFCARFGYNIIGSRSTETQMSLLDDSIDLTGDSGVLKRLIRRGDASKGYPLQHDRVDIAWKLFTYKYFKKVLVHDSLRDLSVESDGVEINEKNTKVFQFRVVGENSPYPREVLLGWDIGVRSMFEGEISSFTITSKYGFGEKGAATLGIAANSSTPIECEIELIKIHPSLSRRYKSVGYNESIKDELMEQIYSGESVISKEVMENKPLNETKSADEIKFFDPEKHKVDPNIRVVGHNSGSCVDTVMKHSWEETMAAIDIDIPLPLPEDIEISKDDVTVDIRAAEISVNVLGRVVLAGPLQGRVVPSMCMWALLPALRDSDGDGVEKPVEGTARLRHHRIQLSLEKGFEHRDIWASALQREYLLSLKKSS